jgi:hypothetical protein
MPNPGQIIGFRQSMTPARSFGQCAYLSRSAGTAGCQCNGFGNNDGRGDRADIRHSDASISDLGSPTAPDHGLEIAIRRSVWSIRVRRLIYHFGKMSLGTIVPCEDIYPISIEIPCRPPQPCIEDSIEADVI